MVWLLIIVLSGVLLLASLTVFLLVGYLTDERDSEVLVELQTRRAERQLHELARNGFERMLDEARSSRSTGVS